jgi:sorbitol-specific phosphotransferase system component IIA
MGTYMDIGEDCVVLSKVGSIAALKELEELGIEFKAVSEAAQL